MDICNFSYQYNIVESRKFQLVMYAIREFKIYDVAGSTTWSEFQLKN
jgi:hypothetical protein